MSDYGHLTSTRESFFTIDTETIGNNDTGIVTNIAMAYVNMPKLVDGKEEGYFLSPKEFYDAIEVIDIYPSKTDQEKNGRNAGGGALDFWKKEFSNAKTSGNETYLAYIIKMMKETPDKLSMLDTINELHKFIKNGVDESLKDGRMRDKDIPFLERGGGFDTNKFYTIRDIVLRGYERNDSIFIPHWARRELRSILSTNKWRDFDIFVDGTNWNKAFTQMVVDDMNMEKHMALFDAVLDAYGVYCLKVTQQQFYL